MPSPCSTPEGLALADLVTDFAVGLEAADNRSPVAVNMRTKVPFQPGIGPHTESQTVKLVMDQMAERHPDRYAAHALGVPYGDGSRRSCDICLGSPSMWDWAIEVKMFRPMGDNGKANDNILMHILSPYPEHRSALTDCAKLAKSDLSARKAVLIYGYECEEMPMETAIGAFEVLARAYGGLGERHSAADH